MEGQRDRDRHSGTTSFCWFTSQMPRNQKLNPVTWVLGTQIFELAPSVISRKLESGTNPEVEPRTLNGMHVSQVANAPPSVPTTTSTFYLGDLIPMYAEYMDTDS